MCVLFMCPHISLSEYVPIWYVNKQFFYIKHLQSHTRFFFSLFLRPCLLLFCPTIILHIPYYRGRLANWTTTIGMHYYQRFYVCCESMTVLFSYWWISELSVSCPHIHSIGLWGPRIQHICVYILFQSHL